MKALCPFCYQEYDVGPEWLEQPASCNNCGNDFIVKKAIRCKECGNVSSGEKTECAFCGVKFRNNSNTNSSGSKSLFFLLAALELLWAILAPVLLICILVECSKDRAGIPPFILVSCFAIYYFAIMGAIIKLCKFCAPARTAKILPQIFNGIALFFKVGIVLNILGVFIDFTQIILCIVNAIILLIGVAVAKTYSNICLTPCVKNISGLTFTVFLIATLAGVFLPPVIFFTA